MVRKWNLHLKQLQAVVLAFLKYVSKSHGEHGFAFHFIQVAGIVLP